MKLLGARDGTLWIGTSGGLASWKNGQLTQYPELSGFFVNTVIEDRNGTVWAGGWGHAEAKARLCAIRSGHVTCYGDDGSLGTAAISLKTDTDGGVWAVAETGLWCLSSGLPVRYVTGATTSSTRGEDRPVLICFDGKVRQIVDGKIKDYQVPGAPSPLTAQSLIRDRQGALWIGTSRGLLYSYQGATRLITHSDGLSSDAILDILEDREGTIWICTSEGLDSFRTLPFDSLTMTHALYSVLAARDGSIWAGTAEGLDRLKDGGIRAYRARTDQGLPGNNLGTLCEDEDGRVWLWAHSRLVVFEAGRFRTVPFVPGGIITAMASDYHGGLWLQLMNNPNDYGLVHLVDGKVIETVPWKALGGGPGAGLVVDPDGGVWAGLFPGGIAYYHAGQIRRLRLSGPDAVGRRVYNLFRARDGALWVAGEQGLSRIANGDVATLTTANGLPCDTVHWVMEDGESSYWLYTACGLLRIERSEMEAWIREPKRNVEPTVFDHSDGISLRSILLPTRPHVSRSPDGKIWFENVELTVIDPSHVGINTVPPPVHIEQVTADGKTEDAASGIHLPALVRNVAIEYTALSLTVPEKVRFRYKLEGQDPDWSVATSDRKVQYSNLAPGTYRFRVIACNNSGVWNEQGDTLEFSVDPAYYQTSWFRVLCAVAFLALLWAIYQLRIRQLKEQEKKFREAVESMPALAFVTSSRGDGTFVNKGWTEYTGMSVEQTASSAWRAAVHPDDLKRVLERERTALATGKPFDCEARLRRGADGQYRWFLVRVVPVHDKRGKVVKWCGVAADIEDRKHAEQLQTELAHVNRTSILGELMASISHEVKQPITATMTNARASLRWLKREKPEVQEACQTIDKILRDGARATEIIDRLRALYKKTPPKRELVSINEVILEMIALLRSEASLHGVSIRMNLIADLPKTMADRVQLQQVLMNLMLNGIEAMTATGGVLTVTSQREDSQVLISVSDTGVGLPNENIHQIFDAFFTTKPHGSGMGLAISQSIIESHGGRLWATANDGRGASFHFSLPIEIRAPEISATHTGSGPDRG
jgi:PAS domain S-box-containing protein